MSTLSEMSDAFEASVDWRDNNARTSSDLAALIHSKAEDAAAGEAAVEAALASLDQSLEAFPFGEELIRERVMFNLDVPFSKNYLRVNSNVIITNSL